MALFGYCLFSSGSAEAFEIPELRAPITDHAQMMSAPTEAKLNALLLKLDKEAQVQIAVLTIPSLEGETIEGASIQVVDRWKLGYEGSDKGLLILVAKKERRMRIETGRGLEGDLPDAYARRIIDGMTRFFKQKQFDEGLSFAVFSVIQRVAPEFANQAANQAPSQNYREPPKKKKHLIHPLLKLLFYLIIFVLLRLFGGGGFYLGGGGFGRGGFGGGGGGGWSGGGGGFSGGGSSGSW